MIELVEVTKSWRRFLAQAGLVVEQNGQPIVTPELPSSPQAHLEDSLDDVPRQERLITAASVLLGTCYWKKRQAEIPKLASARVGSSGGDGGEAVFNAGAGRKNDDDVLGDASGWAAGGAGSILRDLSRKKSKKRKVESHSRSCPAPPPNMYVVV